MAFLDLLNRDSINLRERVESTLSAIWSEVLLVPHVNLHDNFLDLGGSSLLATQVMSRLRDRLKVEVPLRTLFEHPTLAGLAAAIEQSVAESDRESPFPIRKRSRDNALPPSFSQRRMWLLQKLNPEGIAYNLTFTLRLRGPLDHDHFNVVMTHLVERHEAFRTTFVSVGGEPAQLIAPQAQSNIFHKDLRQLPATERDSEAARILRDAVSQPFDLSRAPLFGFHLIQLDDENHIMMWMVHHVIGDDWSFAILFREFAEHIRALKAGRPYDEAPPAIEYADYAAWQRQTLEGAPLDRQMAYWREQLRDLPILNLPTDFTRPARQTFRGSYVAANLPAGALDDLKRVCANHRATPYMALLACFKLLLSRYCGQIDIAVGSPIANRTHLATEGLVGTLVNTLVMRSTVDETETFAQLLARVRDTTLDAYAHQDLPFEQLVAELAPLRDTSHSPLVQVLFNVPNSPLIDIDIAGLKYEPFDFDSGSTQFDLALNIDTELFGRAYLSFATDLFDHATADRMLAHYMGLINQVIADTDKPLSAYSLLTTPERRQIVREWNRTARQYPAASRADELISEQAERTPQAVAVSMGPLSLSYAQLDARSNQLAHLLRERGVLTGSVVGICLERAPVMVVALLAVMKAGGTYVPMDPAFPRDRLEYMAHDAGVALVLTQEHLRIVLPQMQNRMLVLDDTDSLLRGLPDGVVTRLGTPDDLAYVLYTSGSTGKPKGVEIPHRALSNLLHSMRSVPGCTALDTMFSVTTLSFDISGLEIFLPLICGARVELASHKEVSDAGLLIRRISDVRPTLMQATPAMWRMLIEAGWAGSDGLKILCGGEALPRDLADRLLDRCTSLWNLYGPTETTIWSMVERIERGAGISIGRPIANTSIYILDKSLQPVPVGVRGELYIGGHGLARGYRNRPDLTSERFIPNPLGIETDPIIYRTGDLARWLTDGRIEHLGRSDFQVKIRGFRIELGEIEVALSTHPEVGQCVVAAKDDSHGMKQLVAYIIPGGADPPSITSLRALLRASLPEYMVPSHFVYLEAFPYTANRKIDVPALPAPHAAVRERNDDARIEPRGRVEVQLIALWRQVLGDDTIGVSDDFFDRGGHSLKAVQLMSQLERITGKQLPLAMLFQAPTVAAMARLLAASDWVPPWRSLVAIQPSGNATPIFAIPGVGGNVLMFAHFAKLLGTERPFYGLQARGLDDSERPFKSIARMAAHYIAEARSVQPKGPYTIVGSCTGGVVAYEMTRQLRTQGDKVVLLLLESWHPSSAQAPRFTGGFLRPAAFLASKAAEYGRILANTPLAQWPQLVASKLRAARHTVLAESTKEQGMTSYQIDRVTNATWRAVSRYKPQALPGGLLHIMASRRWLAPTTIDTRRMWVELAGADGHALFLEAEDSGQLFTEPHVDNLARVVKTYIESQLE